MFPDQFEYYRAGSVNDAIELLSEHGDREVELLSGGQSLLPTMKTGLASPDVVVDIGDIDGLAGVELDDGTVTIGALTRYADIVDSEVVRRRCPVITEAAESIGDNQVRNRGTVGGNVAHSDPASDLPGAVLAADGTIHARGPDGERAIPADDFFMGMFATALEEEEILTRITVPAFDEGDVGAYVKKASPSSGYAMIGVAAVLETDGDEIDSARVAANGALDHATRLEPVEDALVGESIRDEELPEVAGERATEDVQTFMLMDDLQASSEFRARLLEVYTQRAIEKTFERAEAVVA